MFKEMYLSKAPDGKVCIACGVLLKAKTNMKRHFEEIHEVNDVKYSCPACEMVFHYRRAIQRHLGKFHPSLKGMDLSNCMFRDSS